MSQQNQKGFHLVVVIVIVALLAVALSGVFLSRVMKGKSDKNQGQGLTGEQIASLPDMSYYKDHKSNHFIVDYPLVKWATPYKGSRTATPHNGAHVQFQDAYKEWPQGGNEPSDYPPIYAPVDGYVDRVDYSMPTGEHDQYSIGISFAQTDGKTWSFTYSLEPFVKEPSPGFYRQFIKVKPGDKVKEGQVVAYMYLVKEADQEGAHIHFHISKEGSNGNTYPPAIFSQEVMDQYFARWGGSRDGFEGKGDILPECMGYKLAASENPFGSDAVDCLN